LRDVTSIVLDGGGAGVVIRLDNVPQVFRSALIGQRCCVYQGTTHDRQLAALHLRRRERGKVTSGLSDAIKVLCIASPKVLVGSGAPMETLAGEEKLPSTIIVLEFPSMEQVKAWYHDPVYAPRDQWRQSGSDANIISSWGVSPHC
jgi:uncharacterized protein (DUF1330 family)